MEIYNLNDPIPEGNLTKHKKYDTIKDNAPGTANSFQVTNIKQGIKNPNRVNIFINDKYSFSLDISQVVDYKIKIGQEITPEKLTELKTASEYGKLYQRTLEWVLTRPRSIRETRDYLYRKIRNFSEGISERGSARVSARALWRQERATRPEESVSNLKNQTRPEKDASDFTGKARPEENRSEFSNQIITRLIEKGYLDDQKFAEYYVENRFVKKGISKKRLRMELIKKGITNDIIEQVLESRNDEEEIRKIIAKKRAKYDEDKLIQYLVRQGFDYQLAQTLVRGTD